MNKQLYRPLAVQEALPLRSRLPSQQHHDVQVGHRRTAFSDGAASQKGSSGSGKMFIDNSACHGNWIHAATIRTI